MLFRRETLNGIAEGRITLQFRRWPAPRAKAGGTQLTPIGNLFFESVDRVAGVTDDEARSAGEADAASLLARLEAGSGDIYRIRLCLAGVDPRIAMRGDDRLADDEIAALVGNLDRGFVRVALMAIAENPGRRAADLAARFGLETPRFKARIRTLKAIGLTESLDVGYRISPRGQLVLEWLSRT